MSRRHTGGHTLPENPTWIEFPRSDGDPAQLPRNTTKVVDGEGHVNYMRPVGTEESLSIMWRIFVGTQLAIRMNMPEGPKYVLKDFPDGYQLYDHNKGPAKAPRHDPYLCGSVNVNRFRSTNEFIPHALWLIQDPTLNRSNCQCKYCTKQPQRIISDTMGLSARRSASVAATLPPSARTSRLRREAREPRQPRAPPTKPYAAVRRAPKPPKTLVGPEQYISPERDLDIRTSHNYGQGSSPRWFRKGELLWCHVHPPIRGRTADEDIIFWPGLVDDIQVRTLAIPIPVPNGDVSMGHLYAEAADGNPALGMPAGEPSADPSSASSPAAPIEAQGAIPWRVHQSYVYKVKLLGTHVNFHVEDEHVLPYLAYAPSESILNRVQAEFSSFLQNVPIEQMDRDLDENMFLFDPLYPEPEGEHYFEKYQRAASSYTLAIQIASNVAQFWLPTDEWECKFVVTPPTTTSVSASASRPQSPTHPVPPTHSHSASQPQPQPQPQTLLSAIQQTYVNNAISPATVAGPSGSQPSEAESISMAGYVTRSVTAQQQPVVQTRFQGLWWGTERIWTDELVRLKIARGQFAPKGTDVIYPPAGPSASALAAAKENPESANVLPERLGSSEKGLFLRLEGLFVVDVPSADGTGSTKECRASGMVYELVDEDWVEEITPNGVNGSDNGKGKARESADEAMSISQGPGGSTPSFMAQPSPLKPPPLPNPDPTVPASDASSSIPEQTSPAAADTERVRSLSSQLSHPVLSTPYPLPPASVGYRFRPILPPGHEVVISLSLISGRYYPRLFYHPLMTATVAHAVSEEGARRGLFEHRHLWAMDGLLPGVHQSMDPRFWRSSRVVMLQEADKDARSKFKERWEEVKMTRLHASPEPMQEQEGAVTTEAGGDQAAMEVD